MKATTHRKAGFRSAAEFKERTEAYLQMCCEKRRLPNPAGFCVFSSISRAQFAALREKFPLQYDLCCAAFLDEAINLKCPNSSAVLQYLRTLTESDGVEEGSFRLYCEGGLEDGI